MVNVMGKLSRDKGAATEREVVNLHRKIGVTAERVPLSGAMKYQGNGQDVDVFWDGPDHGATICQVKRNLRGVTGVIKALGDADMLFLRWDAEPGERAQAPLVVMPWATYERLIKRR